MRALNSKGLKGDRGMVFYIGIKGGFEGRNNLIDITTQAEIENVSTDMNHPI